MATLFGELIAHHKRLSDSQIAAIKTHQQHLPACVRCMHWKSGYARALIVAGKWVVTYPGDCTLNPPHGEGFPSTQFNDQCSGFDDREQQRLTLPIVDDEETTNDAGTKREA